MAVKIPNSIDELPISEPALHRARVKRVEDTGLVTGRTEFIDNVSMTGMLHCAILRSPDRRTRRSRRSTSPPRSRAARRGRNRHG